MKTILILTWHLVLPLIFVFALFDIFTQSERQQIRRMKKTGKSQVAIAKKLNITRYKVRLALA